MEENLTAVTTEAATDGDVFEGWQDAGFDGVEEPAADVQEGVQGAQETNAQAEPGNDAAEEVTGVQGGANGENGGSNAASEQQAVQDAPIEVTYMNETRTLSRDEAVQLAQKGMDYDRIRQKWNDARETILFIDEQAKAAGMNRTDFVNFLRVEAKKSQGVSEEEAQRTVDLENREAVIHEQEAAERQRLEDQQAQQRAAQEQQARRDADFRRFAQKFPDVDAKTIGPDVWERVGKGESLTEIWLEKENDRLKQEQAVAEQNAKNAGRSTGSMASSGGETMHKDPFDEGWD